MAQIARSQTYHPLVQEGKLWTTYHYFCLDYAATSDYTRFEGDTVIGAVTYKKIWVSTDLAMTQWHINGLIREDAQKKVFLTFSDPSNEFLLYDFNAAAGDTLHFHDNLNPYVLDSIGTYTLLSGEQRKSFMLHCTVFPCFENWIEGIGSITKGVLEGGTCGFVGDDPEMMCDWENDTMKYHSPDYSGCFVITSINNLLQNGQKIRVFPNPASDAITVEIKSGTTISLRIEILDLTGRICLEKNLRTGVTVIPLRKNPIPGGIYLYHIFAGNEILTTGKLTIL
jgi:hypothetical protein